MKGGNGLTYLNKMGWWTKKQRPEGNRKDLGVIEEKGGEILDFIDDKMTELEDDEEIEDNKLDSIQESLAVYVMAEMLDPFDATQKKKILKEVAKAHDLED